jgi:general stress protein 26
MKDLDHKNRIYTELVDSGISKYSLRKNEVKYLPNVIHEDEHILASINGRADVGSVMLVATDKRVIFLDCKPFYTTVDELTYDIVSGVYLHTQGLFSNVILHTRIGDYNLKFVKNIKQAKRFIEAIEQKRLESSDEEFQKGLTGNPQKPVQDKQSFALSKEQKQFLNTHYLGVISTINRTGGIDASPVYYLVKDEIIYILTKSETSKSRNILTNPLVSFTLFEEASYEVMEIKGIASVVTDGIKRNKVFNAITKFRNMSDGVSLPPVTKIEDGSYVIIGIKILEAKYNKYK